MDALKKLVDFLPVSNLSIIVTVAIDLLWSGFELPATFTVVGLLALCVILGFLVLVVVTLVEAVVSKKPFGQALVLGLAMGVIAAVPYPVTSILFAGLKLTRNFIGLRAKTDQSEVLTVSKTQD